MSHVLDNPIWYALTSAHSCFAEGERLAKRYPPAISPLGAMASQSLDAYHDLRKIIQPGKHIFLFLDIPAEPPTGWKIEASYPIVQMICETLTDIETGHPPIEILPDSAAEEMVALTALTKPGPFNMETKQLGIYAGIRQEGRLAAMAGERLHLTGYTEVSAVCTHPDFRGKGYAKVLVAAAAKRVLERGETPFLHVVPRNATAIQVYEKLGFRQRRLIHFANLQKL